MRVNGVIPTPRTHESVPPVENSEGAAPRGRLSRPKAVARETVHLGKDFVSIAMGTDEHRPAEKDKRFADATWRTHPGYRRVAQNYTAWTAALNRLVDQAEADGADWRDVERARFAVNALTAAMAPTNTLLGNPAALKKAIDTGGRACVRGVRSMVDDVRHNGGHAAVDRPPGVRRRPRPRRQQGRGRLPGRRHRAHPVLPDDAAGARAAAADRAAADRPLLLPRPAAGPQLRRVRRRPGPADVHDQLAQPDPEAAPTGTSTPTPSGVRRAIGRAHGRSRGPPT